MDPWLFNEISENFAVARYFLPRSKNEVIGQITSFTLGESKKTRSLF